MIDNKIKGKKGVILLLQKYITEKTFLTDVECNNWEEVVQAAADLLIKDGAIEPEYVDAVKDAIHEFGSYMVLLDDIAFFHGRPCSAVHRLAMGLVTLKSPVYLLEKRIKAAFLFAAVDNNSHMELLQEFGEALQDEMFLKLLRENGTKEEILNKINEGGM